MMKIYFNIALAFLATLLLLPLLRWLAVKFKILDFPGGRKIHKVATPLLGGVAIYFGFIIGVLPALKNFLPFLLLLTGASAILILGLINDLRPLSARTRFFCQSLIALAVVLGGVRVSFLPTGLLGDTTEIFITVFWLVGVTNAYNYLDGLDGLAVGSAIINLGCFAWILYTTRQPALGRLSLVLAASCLGFLPYNLKNAKIFLGEAGSTFLGFMLAGIAIIGNWAEDNVVKLAIPILILGLPIFDMIFTTIIRVKEKKVKNLREWLEYSDRDHFHYSLVELGLRPLAAVVFVYSIVLSLGISAIIMVSNDIVVECFLSLLQAAIIAAVIGVLIVIAKKHQKGYSA